MEQRDVLAQLGKIGPARRGQISEQWFESNGRDGKVRRTGPYYVWQRFLDGRKSSMRIPREEAARAMEELRRGKQATELIGQFWANAEAAAATVKKTTGKTLRRVSAQSSVKLSH
jgi:hypothetical protein